MLLMQISDMGTYPEYEEIGMRKRLLRSLLYCAIYNVALVVFIMAVSYEGKIFIPLVPFFVLTVVVSLCASIFFFLVMLASPFIRERHLKDWFEKRSEL